MAMKAYKSYKNVDLPWLKRVPEHWEVARNKNFLSEQKAIVGDNFANYSLLSLTLNGVIIRDVNNGKGKFPASFNTYKIVSPGNMVFCLFDIDETPRTVGLSTHYGMITNAYEVLGVHNITPQYLYYYYLQLDNRKALKPLYHGLRKTITIGTFLQTKLPVPPKKEQDQIVRYLDWQNSRLNKLINAKKKEIALLEEQKQALISQAVTKGLDPHAPLKDSGIDWIGQIPEHWEIRRLKSMLKSPLEYGANMSGIPYDSSLPRYIRITDIETSTTLKSDNKLSLPISDLTSRYLLKTGDVLFARSGATVAKTYIVSENDLPAAYAGYLIKCCANEKYLLPLFLLFYSQSHPYTLWKDAIFIQATIQNISAEKYNNLQLPVPSVTEQTEICEYLARKSSYFDNIIKIKAKTISLLQEYRTRLVADVVTGQIDVRNIAIPNYETVPETIDQPETAEESTISAEDQ